MALCLCVYLLCFCLVTRNLQIQSLPHQIALGKENIQDDLPERRCSSSRSCGLAVVIMWQFEFESSSFLGNVSHVAHVAQYLILFSV